MIEKTEALNFRLESELKAAFLAACKANDVTAAQVLRAAAREYLEKAAKNQNHGGGDE